MISFDCRAACETQASSKFVISEQVRECVGQFVYRTSLDQQAVYVMFDEPRYAGNPRRHDGNLQRHRLEQHIRQPLAITAERKNVDPFIKGNRFRLVPHETNSVISAQRGNQVLERFLLISLPHDPQFNVEASL